ncbi:MAG: MFS transporter [Deltaproteobacteria bacterium]|nr:MFS transporter [Nannocystaceae bacterium]
MDPVPVARRGALAMLVVLTAINFVNYIDRYVVSAVAELIGTEFALEDDVTGLVGSAFMIAYTVVAPLAGWLGDRVQRRRIVAVSVAAWSLATLGSAWAPDVETLLLMRALVGIGEAGYATVAPSMIADLFHPAQRGRKLSWFYLAIPLGSALGYLVGGAVGEPYGWRAAFMVASVPGLVLAVVAWFVPEPERGAMDEPGAMVPMSIKAAWREMLASKPWRAATVGMTLMTFAMGGIAFWMPAFLQRAPHQLGPLAANLLFGGVTVVAGLLGTVAGGVLGDRLLRRHAGGYFSISGWGLLLGAPFVLLMPLVDNLVLALCCAFAAETLLFLNTGPLNAALVGAVPVSMRASAFAVNVFCIHAFGDAGSPVLLGWLSKATALAWAISACAVPIALGGWVLLREAKRLRVHGGPPP